MFPSLPEIATSTMSVLETAMLIKIICNVSSGVTNIKNCLHSKTIAQSQHEDFEQ